MKVLGFRSDPKAPRYAVVSEDDGQYILENASTDNKLTVPAWIAEDADDDRVEWIYQEILRIFEEYPDIAKVIIKTNEFTQTDSNAKRRSTYNDAIMLLACAHQNISVEAKTYTSMGTTSRNTKCDAEFRVGRTDTYWNTKMADAVNAAWWGLCH